MSSKRSTGIRLLQVTIFFHSLTAVQTFPFLQVPSSVWLYCPTVFRFFQNLRLPRWNHRQQWSAVFRVCEEGNIPCLLLLANSSCVLSNSKKKRWNQRRRKLKQIRGSSSCLDEWHWGIDSKGKSNRLFSLFHFPFEQPRKFHATESKCLFVVHERACTR